ncbi:MAG: asparagine synthase-related protein [Patescibacteria group bacterium]|jgi:asparagine synthase (glutamine-hydrolysing)
MCSIAGLVGVTGIEKMIKVQAHRAPDESGVFKDGPLELGMGRLKILDLTSGGLAPYEEDHFVIVYNGEIYNYVELRKELKRLGWIFRTTGDTEVLLKAWREWGMNMFDRLNGMFAFAIYDKRRKKLVLARDIAGEKPLYFYRKGRAFGFASEAKALHKVLPLKERDDEHFHVFQHIHHKTLWEHVEVLPPAHVAVFDIATRELRVKPYWTFKPREIKLKTAPEELEALLEHAVKIRTRSDVPYGLYYSKGIDSSLIASLYPFKHKFYFDDTKDWKQDFYAKIDKIAWHLDFPVGSLSSYPLWKLAERATKKVRVVLSGEGADEIFGGYIRYMPLAREWEMRQRYPSYTYLFNKYYPAYLDGFARITARKDSLELVRETIRPYFEMFEDPVNAMGFADFKLVMPSLLQMGDRMASAHSLENRCPFLDRRVIEFGFSLPSELKIAGLDQKVVLRKILAKRGLWVPLRNEKKGLTIKFNTWFGKKDWDRGAYFNLLIERWRKAFSRG